MDITTNNSCDQVFYFQTISRGNTKDSDAGYFSDF